MHAGDKKSGFTLIELLVVIAVLSVLLGIVVPSVTGVREQGRAVKCRSNLHTLAGAMTMYHNENNGFFWPYVIYNHPENGVHTYFWGSNTDPVDTRPSPFMKYVGGDLAYLWCPSLKWGEYIPQGGVNEPTTTYGYNSWCLDPVAWGRRDDDGNVMKRKRTADLSKPSQLFVFADSAMYWAPGGVDILQNSTSLDPVKLGSWGQNTTPTTHFRHDGKTNVLCADGHSDTYGPEGGPILKPKHNLGFVGDENVPHYDCR